MVVGVDVSSKRIDLAWVSDGKPQRWHQQLDTKAHLIDRLRSIRVEWPGRHDYQTTPTPFDVTDIAIEKPFSTSRRSTAALSAVTGIVTRQAPPWARVAWPSSGELRAAIGARNTKQAAHLKLIGSLQFFQGPDHDLEGWDEHSLDALVAAVGWAKILDSQEGPEQVELGHPVGVDAPAHRPTSVRT